MTEGALWYLKRCGLFEGLTPEQAKALEQNTLVRNYAKGSLIYAPAQPADSVMVLARGRVKIKDITVDGKEAILAFIEEGEVFGELALLDGQPRQRYAEAVQQSRILAVGRDCLLRLMEDRPDLALSVTKLVGLRLQRIENRLCNVLFLPGRERMLRLLAELVESHGEPGPGAACEIRLPLSHQELAGLVGLTRETVTGILGQLQADRLIKVRRLKITVLDRDRLHQERDGRSGRWPALCAL